MSRLITIKPDGSLVTLETKTGLDVKKLGTASVVRSSLIEWVESEQAWQIRLLHGTHAGLVSDHLAHQHMNGSHDSYYYPPRPWWSRMMDYYPWGRQLVTRLRKRQILLWNNYDDAVKAEIELIQAMRQKGITV